MLWLVFENERALSAALRLAFLLCRNDMRKLLQARRPHLIISVHPLMQHLFLRLLEEEGERIPFVTVVTDLASFHRGWFHAQAERCFVASGAAADAARGHGLRAGQIHLLGLPVRAAFAGTLPDRETARAGLGLADTAFIALLVGGGEGMGAVAAIARAVALRLAAAGTGAQLVVICGRNDRLRRALQQVDWPLPVQVHGFVDNMEEWMAAGDCIVTKAGPGTIAEALICGLPILLSGFIPGQEAGNVPFVVENGVGAYCNSPDGIAAIVSGWSARPPTGQLQTTQADGQTGGADLAQMAARARSLGRPRAPPMILLMRLRGFWMRRARQCDRRRVEQNDSLPLTAVRQDELSNDRGFSRFVRSRPDRTAFVCPLRKSGHPIRTFKTTTSKFGVRESLLSAVSRGRLWTRAVDR